MAYMYFEIDITQQECLLALIVSKKHRSLDFFPQESTLALPSFWKSPLVTLRTQEWKIKEKEKNKQRGEVY